MRSEVTISWGPSAQYAFDLEEVQPMPHDIARQWLDDQFVALGCEPLRPSGKVLLADKVVCVAQAAGEACFREAAHGAWSRVYARACSALLAKPRVHVDVPSMSVSY